MNPFRFSMVRVHHKKRKIAHPIRVHRFMDALFYSYTVGNIGNYKAINFVGASSHGLYKGFWRNWHPPCSSHVIVRTKAVFMHHGSDKRKTLNPNF